MFKIIITEITEEPGIEQEFKKTADSGNEKDNGPVYGYVDKKVTIKNVNEIYTQKVEDIDLVGVINAVNAKASNVAK